MKQHETTSHKSMKPQILRYESEGRHIIIFRLEAHHSPSNGPLVFGLWPCFIASEHIFPKGPRLCWIWTKCCKLRQWLDEMSTNWGVS